MPLLVYLLLGLVTALAVLGDMRKSSVQYTKKEIIIGFFSDVLIWPLVILGNIALRIIFRMKRFH